MTTQAFDVNHAIPTFTPDVIKHLYESRQFAVDKAEKSLQAHQEWMNRAAQWDDLIRRAESYTEQPEQSWQSQNEVGGEDGTSVLPQIDGESAP